MNTQFDAIFSMQSGNCASQTHKVFKVRDGLYINVVDVCQTDRVERNLCGEHDTLTQALDAMVEQFKIDEQSTIESFGAQS